jgi:hypothetical protein
MRLHLIITGLSYIVPSKISEIVPDFIGINGFFIETENSFINASSEWQSISEEENGTLSVNDVRKDVSSSVNNGDFIVQTA